MLAKEIVNSKKAISRITTNKAQMMSIGNSLTEQLGVCVCVCVCVCVPLRGYQEEQEDKLYAYCHTVGAVISRSSGTGLNAKAKFHSL